MTATKAPDFSRSIVHPNYRPDIDGLRALAVLSVVAFHAFPSLIRGGFIGVDVFFVISGYLISTIIFNSVALKVFSFRVFYARRIRRIFPALIVVMVLSLLYGWFALLPKELAELGKHIVGGSAFLSNIMLWFESGYFDRSSDLKPMLHLWSLGVEEQFYIFWPLLAWIAWWRGLSWFWLVTVLCAGSFLANVEIVNSAPTEAFYSPYTRFWELLVGSFLAYCSFSSEGRLACTKKFVQQRLLVALFRRSPIEAKKIVVELASITGFVLIGLALWNINSEMSFPGYWALLPVLGAACLISSGPSAFLNRAILSNKIAVWFGLISFPLYLWHWPVLTFLRISVGDMPAREWRIGAVAVSVLLAWLTYRFVEKPLRELPMRITVEYILVVSMAILAGIGFYIYRSEGVPQRFPAIIQSITTYKFDPDYVYRRGTCYLDVDQGEALFSNCKDESSGNRKSLLLWGDSHAAHLYAGYKKSFGVEYAIIQRNASGCPPILGLKLDDAAGLFRPMCFSINNMVINYARINHPDRVVLSARWDIYNWNGIKDTIIALQSFGISDIDVIGPVPEWKESLPKQLYRYFQKSDGREVPERMSFGLDPVGMASEESLRKLVESLGARYISAKSILCNEDGCITRFGGEGRTLSAWDEGHLTEEGSEQLVSKFPR